MSKDNKPKMVNMVAKPTKSDQQKLGKQVNYGQIRPQAPPRPDKSPRVQSIDEGQRVPARPPAPSKIKGRK